MEQNNMNETNEMTVLADLQKELENKEKGLYPKFSDALFKPFIFASQTNNFHNTDFDSIYIPFKVIGNRVYCINYFDSVGTKVMLTVITEKEDESGQKLCTNCDAIIKEALQIQQDIGIEYSFGKLNRAVKHYIDALRILLEKKYITHEEYVKLCEDIGFTEEAGQEKG